MLEKEKKLIIEKIQDSKMDLSLIFSGCGFQFLNNILKVSGSSKFFIKADGLKTVIALAIKAETLITSLSFRVKLLLLDIFSRIIDF